MNGAGLAKAEGPPVDEELVVEVVVAVMGSDEAEDDNDEVDDGEWAMAPSAADDETERSNDTGLVVLLRRDSRLAFLAASSSAFLSAFRLAFSALSRSLSRSAIRERERERARERESAQTQTRLEPPHATPCITLH